MNKTETTYNNTDVIEKVEEIYIRVDELYDDIKYENYVSSSWKKVVDRNEEGYFNDDDHTFKTSLSL